MNQENIICTCLLKYDRYMSSNHWDSYEKPEQGILKKFLFFLFSL